MKDLNNLIDKLKQTDKDEDSFLELYCILKDCFNDIGIMVHNLYKGYRLVRIRINESDIHFESISDLSYKPKKFNKSYQRASIPNETMFYASSCERKSELNNAYTDDKYGIKVALFETIPDLRSNCLHGKGFYDFDDFNDNEPYFKLSEHILVNRKVTYSIWEVKELIKLARVCPFYPINNYSDKLIQEYLFNYYMRNNSDLLAFASQFYQYLTNEFSRIGISTKRECDYMISAITSKILIEIGFDGVSYPSARCDSQGINFAITPNITDTLLRCVEVGELDIKSINKTLNVNYIKCLKLNPHEKNFVL